MITPISTNQSMRILSNNKASNIGRSQGYDAFKRSGVETLPALKSATIAPVQQPQIVQPTTIQPGMQTTPQGIALQNQPKPTSFLRPTGGVSGYDSTGHWAGGARTAEVVRDPATGEWHHPMDTYRFPDGTWGRMQRNLLDQRTVVNQ